MKWFGIPKQTIPNISSILPAAASQEIKNGRLPILNTSKVFLKQGERCHYIDKAIYEKEIKKKQYVRNYNGLRLPGIIFKEARHYTGRAVTNVVEDVQYETVKGILYITNLRLIFQGERNGFEIKKQDLVAIQPYGNCVEIQCKKGNYKIFVPDGMITHMVLQMIT